MQAEPLSDRELARWGSGMDYLRSARVWVEAAGPYYRTRLPVGARQGWDGLVATLISTLDRGIATLEAAWQRGQRRAAYSALVTYVRQVETNLDRVKAFLAEQGQTFEGRLWTSYAQVRDLGGRVLTAGIIGLGTAAAVAVGLLALYLAKR